MQASLRATCEEHKIKWFEDPTNAVTTYAMRNAIRSIVKNQNDLPLALRKERIVALQQKGSDFRSKLVRRVNKMMGLGRYSLELFNKTLKAEIPESLFEVPERILRHFIPMLVRIWREEGQFVGFRFHGTAEDSSSITFMKTFVKLQHKSGRFNVQGAEIIKKKHIKPGWINFIVNPEVPRHALRKHEIELKPVPSSDDREWREYQFDFPPSWPQMHKIKVFARGNTQFYFRNWKEGEKGDTRIIDAVRKELAKGDRQRWGNVPGRIRQYPACLYAVLCHRENSPNYRGKKIEWIDAVPQFGININPNVRTTTDGTYDLHSERGEWKELQVGRTTNFELKKPHDEKYVNANAEGKVVSTWWTAVREAQRKEAHAQKREAAADLQESRNGRLDI